MKIRVILPIVATIVTFGLGVVYNGTQTAASKGATVETYGPIATPESQTTYEGTITMPTSSPTPDAKPVAPTATPAALAKAIGEAPVDPTPVATPVPAPTITPKPDPTDNHPRTNNPGNVTIGY